MKYWEVVKRLTENPALSGMAVIDSIRYELYVNDSGTLESKTYYLELGTNGTSIGKAGKIDFDGWEIVRQPVPWQEAIQEFAKGKKLIVKLNNQEWTLGALVELPKYLDIAITKGEWYVED